MASNYRLQNALNRAVRDEIRGTLAYPAASCELTFDGRPTPRSGKVFVGVHRGERRSLHRECLEEDLGVAVTLTMRINEPPDRWGPDLIGKVEAGLDDRADQLRVCVHRDCKDYRIIRAANKLLGAGTDGYSGINGFVEPLSFQQIDQPRIVGAGWFLAKPEAVELGLAVTLRFGGAKVLQTLDDMI